MKLPLQINFLGMEPSEAVEAAAREKATKLEHFCRDIVSCRVDIELLHKHQHQGRPYEVRIDLRLPDHHLAVNRVHNEDVYVSLRDAFDDMRRQVEDAVRRTRGQEKVHATPLHGEVVRFGTEPPCGFIRTPDGDEYYFDPDSLAGVRFDELEVGTPVQFIGEGGAQGRQAKRVSIGKHGFG